MSKFIVIVIYTVLFALVLPATGSIVYPNYAAALLVGLAISSVSLVVASMVAPKFVTPEMLFDAILSGSTGQLRTKIIALTIICVVIPFVVAGALLTAAVTVVSWPEALAITVVVAAVHGYLSVQST